MTMTLICRDGVLRVREWHKKSRSYVFLPLRTLQAHRDHAFLASVAGAITLETGLTVLELFENLEPWADVISGLAQMDFPAFLAEARLPPQPDADFSHIELVFSAIFRGKPAFGRPNSQRFLVGRARVTDEIEPELGWEYRAMTKVVERIDHGSGLIEVRDHASLSYAPLDGWAHLPISISRRMWLVDQTGTSEHLSFGTTLLNPAHPHRVSESSEVGPTALRDVEIPISAPTPTFMDTLIRGFLADVGFNWTPPGRDGVGDVIRSRLDDLITSIEAAKENGKPVNRIGKRVLFEDSHADRAEADRLDAEGVPQERDYEIAPSGTPDEDDLHLEHLIEVCRREDRLGEIAVRIEPESPRV